MPRLRPVQESAEDKTKQAVVASTDDEKPQEQNGNDVQVEVEPQQENAVEVEAQTSESESALKKQLDELRRSEQLLRQQNEQSRIDREAALRQAQERDSQIKRYQQEVSEKEELAIDSALAAAKAEAEKAEGDIVTAGEAQDYKALANAQRRLSRAEANLAALERGKDEIESRKKTVTETQTPQQQQSTDPLEQGQLALLPPVAKNWLRGHMEVLTDPRKNAKLGSVHWDAVDAGHAAYSDGYFKFVEEQMGYRQREQTQERQQEQQRASIMSAPVSRETPNSNGVKPSTTKVRLTAEQREIAKMAGISESEYAKQLLKMNEMVANGTYGGRQ